MIRKKRAHISVRKQRTTNKKRYKEYKTTTNEIQMIDKCDFFNY